MPFKLKVSKPAPPSWYHEYEFDKDSVTIGREARCDLQLEGINSVVSREHARISRKGDGYVLVDLESRNFTFLKGKRLKPGAEHVLAEGDIFRICDYEIEFSLKTDLVVPERECLVPAEPPPPNPFLGALEELARVVEQLSVAYDLSGSPIKKDELRAGLDETLEGLKGRKAAEIIGETLAGERRRPTLSIRQEGPADVDILANYDRVNRLLDTLLEFFVKLIQARLQFRQEFLGETIVKSKSFTLDNCTARRPQGLPVRPRRLARRNRREGTA
jgi:pSer/pThr/pTyr-binding forkhead associated (FHA) protein